MAAPTHVATSTVVAGTTSCTPSYPATLAAGDLLLMAVAAKPDTVTMPTISGWTLQVSQAVGSGTAGPATGPQKLAVYSRVSDGTETGTITVTPTGTSNVVEAGIGAWRVGSGKVFATNYDWGTDATVAANLSITKANPGTDRETANDVMWYAMCHGANNNMGSTGVTATGATYGSNNEQSEVGSSNGDDIRLGIMDKPISSGTATAATVAVATNANTSSGGAVFVRLREVAPTFTGTAAQTLPRVAQAASGTFTGGSGGVTGTAAQTLPRVTQAAAGTAEAEYEGAAAQTLPHLTQAAVGTFTAPSSTTQQWTGIGFTDGAAITTANSGGAAGDALTITLVSTGTALAEDTNPTFTEHRWCKLTNAGGTDRARAHHAKTGVNLSARGYFRVDTDPAATVTLMTCLDNSGSFATAASLALVNTGGVRRLRLLDGAGATLCDWGGITYGTSGTNKYMLDLALLSATATTGVWEVRVYDSTRTELPPTSGAVTGTTADFKTTGFARWSWGGSAGVALVLEIATLKSNNGSPSALIGSAGVVGVAAQTLPHVTQTASGTAEAEYEGAIAQTLPHVTQSAAGTFEAEFEGAAAQTLPHVTQAAAGTRTVPVFTGVGAQSLPHVTQTASGTAEAEYEGAIAQTLPRVTQSASGTAEAEYEGTAAQALPHVTQSMAGTRTVPVFTGSAGQTLPPVTQTASGTVEAEYEGTAAQTLPRVTQSMSGTVDNPGIAGNITQTLPPVTQAAAGTFHPVYTGTAAQTLPRVTQAAAGTRTVPVFTGAAAQTLPRLSQAVSGTFEPVSTGVIIQTLPRVTQSGAGTLAGPTVTGSGAQTLPRLTQTGAGTFALPVSTGTAVQTLPHITQSGAGTHTAPTFTGAIAQTLPMLTQAAAGGNGEHLVFTIGTGRTSTLYRLGTGRTEHDTGTGRTATLALLGAGRSATLTTIGTIRNTDLYTLGSGR